MSKSKLKLSIELVPESCWYKSLRTEMPRRRWDKFRNEVIEASHNACDICGSKDKLHCHEIWEYDDKKRIQKLVGFQTVCNMCHFVHHIGLASNLANQGHLDFDAVIQHFGKVNKLKKVDFEQHHKEAFALWEKRSKLKWKSDLGKYSKLLDG